MFDGEKWKGYKAENELFRLNRAVQFENSKQALPQRRLRLLERRGIRSKRVGILYLEQRTSQYIWEGLENLSGNPCTSLGIGQRVVVVFEVKTAAFGHRVELMIG